MEDKMMMNIIHENYLKNRVVNKKKMREKEELTYINKFIIILTTEIVYTRLITMILIIKYLNPWKILSYLY